MSTHSFEIEETQPDRTAATVAVERPDQKTGHIPDPDDDDLMFDVQSAAVRGFHTPYHPM